MVTVLKLLLSRLIFLNISPKSIILEAVFIYMSSTLKKKNQIVNVCLFINVKA